MASAKQQQQTATSLPKCASCGRDVGVAAGCIPFNVDDSATTGTERARHECFCPTCFVYVRSPREPERWRPGCFLALRCGKCGLESVAIGQSSCMQCSRPELLHAVQSRSVVILGPRARVV